MNFFGRPKEPAAKPRVDPEQVMRQLTELSTKISETEKKREHSFKVAEQFRQRARLAMKAGRRDDAKMELTRAKMEDTRCAKFNGFITQMEALRMGLQAAAENRDMVDTLRAGTASLTAAMGGRDLVGEMDDVSDDMQEAMGDIREVSDRFAQPLGLSALTGVSDDDLEREMAALEGEMAAPAYVPAAAAPVAPPAYTPTAAYTPAAPAGLPAVPSGMPLPTVPTAAPATGARAAVALAAPAAPAAAAAAPASAFDDLLAEMS